MINAYEQPILARLVRGEHFWGRKHSRQHVAAQSLLLRGLVAILEFNDGNFVAFPPNMTWDYRNHKPIIAFPTKAQEQAASDLPANQLRELEKGPRA